MKCHRISLFLIMISALHALPLEMVYSEVDNTNAAILNVDDFEANVGNEHNPTTAVNKSHEMPIHSSVVNLEGEPTGIVNNCVNVITGNYSDLQVDLVVPGPQPITIHRAYSSASDNSGYHLFSHGWNLNHEGVMEITKEEPPPIYDYEGNYVSAGSDPPTYYANTKEGYGIRLCYKGLFKNGLQLHPEITSNKFTNCGAGEISGRTNLRNTRIYKYNKHALQMILGSGIERIFEQQESSSSKFLLTEEQHPCGNQICYQYDSVNNRLKKITAQNAAGDPLAYVLLDKYTTEQGTKEISRVVNVHSSQGKSIKYSFVKLGDSQYLSDVERPNAPPEHYTYEKYERAIKPYGETNTYHQLVGKSRPNGQFQEIEYYDRGDHKVLMENIHVGKDSPVIGRVKYLKAPVGTDKTPIITHTFKYEGHEPKGFLAEKKFIKGHTDVYDAHKRWTRYTYDSHHRLTSVKKMRKMSISFEGIEAPKAYSDDHLYWSEHGNLIFRVFNGEDKCYFCRHFLYDEQRNVIEEKLWGNLTGRYTKSVDFDHGKILSDKKCEVSVKKRCYDPQFNLLVQEEDERKIVNLGYYPDTDLLMYRFVKDEGKICLRQFYEYDANAVLIKEIRDDGSSEDKADLSSVTERHIKYIHPSKKDPIGLPEVIEEKYLDFITGQERLLSKVVNEYSDDGNLLRQQHYDSNDTFVYALRWEYNSMGKITLESNALGETVSKNYDENGNLIYEKKSGTDYHKEMTYDYANRLIRVEDVHAEGWRLAVCYKYDELSQKTASIDAYGNETKYGYDKFGRLDKIIHPSVPNEKGQLIPSIERITYNPMNHPISKIDPLGNETKSEFTIRGKPYRVEYPDGSVETCEYTLDGLLEKSVAKSGVETFYQYDYLGRLTSKKIKSSSGELLSSSSATYNPFHMLSETDAAGRVLTYEYDAAGRLERLRKGGSLVLFQYDSLGRVSKTLEYYGSNEQDYVVKVQEYDLLNRVIEERTEDAAGNTLKKAEYKYDVDGNRIEVKTCNQAGVGITRTAYNPYQEPILFTDANGVETKTIIHYTYQNEFKQGVACKEIVDPLGNVSMVIHDVRGRVATTIRKNSLGQIIQKKQFFYDACGNRSRSIDTVITPNASNREVVSTYEYDSLNRLISYVEAVGSPEQKLTRQTYNPYGQKESIIKPDGVYLHHEYDLLGRLSLFKSSDGSFQYRYTYDPNNNPILILDEKNHSMTERKYNENNHMIEETLGNGLSIRYSYDRMGRPLTVTFPDNSGMGYHYSACFLKEVRRLTKEKKVLYAHLYNKYDLVGSVTADTLIENGGMVDYEYDLLGRSSKISSKHWKEVVPSEGYDKVGNLLSYSITDAIGKTNNKFSYDDLYQLTSEKGSTNHQYAFDSLYNRVEKDAIPYAVNGLNQLLSDSRSSYTYDLNGNLQQKMPDDIHYTYDALDRLASVIQGGNQTRYTYDAFNRRLSKTSLRQNPKTKVWSEETTTRYFYQGQNEVGACDAKGNITELRLLGSGKGAEIGAAIAIELQGELFAPLHDHNGNVMSLVNPRTAQVEETYRYSAYGEEIIFNKSGEEVKETRNPWRFSSKRVDEETHLVYFGRRYYDPQTGRWLTPDPIGESAGPNLYAYVNNSPLTHFDAYGLWMEPMRPEQKTYLRSPSRGFEGSEGGSDRGIGSFAGLPGSILEFIGRYVLSIFPPAGDIVEITGRVLSGKGFKDFVPFYRRPAPGHYYIEGREVPGLATSVNMGVGHRFEDVYKVAAIGYYETGGDRIDFAYYGNGLIYDCISCICAKLKIPTTAARIMLSMQRNLLKKAGPNGKLFQGAHSWGGEVINYTSDILNKSERDHMYVYPFGAPTIIDKEAFAKVRPFVDIHDGIANNIFNWKKNDQHVTYIESGSFPLVQHSFLKSYIKPYCDKMLGDYKKAREEILK